jgi:hypothetical protein
MDCLRSAGVSTSSTAPMKVMDAIAPRHPIHLSAAAGYIDASFALYKEVNEMPATNTRHAIQEELNASIRHPTPDQKLVLMGSDLCMGRLLMIKLLAPPDLLLRLIDQRESRRSTRKSKRVKWSPIHPSTVWSHQKLWKSS